MATVCFFNETSSDLSEFEPILRAVVYESVKMAGVGGLLLEVGLTFMDNAAIRALNKRFRQIDSATDVLSFPMYDSVSEWPETGQALIGDIVISIEKAKAQSEEYGHSLARELGFLTAHSMLHLMGRDHMAPADEAEMIRLQENILQSAGLPR